ncbi:MAG: FGGY-family carbohydrate kinase, partial [bacterium]
YMVPAFTGLGAPHWDSHARGAIVGITRDTGIAHLVRAALEAVCFQSRELIEAMIADSGKSITKLRADGGMVVNHWLLQFLSDILNVEVEQPKVIETTALGAAFLAGLQHGIYQSTAEIAVLWQKQHHFSPEMDSAQRQQLAAEWERAINRVKNQG